MYISKIFWQRLIILVFVLGMFLPLSYVFAGNISSTYKYAWSNNVGYINFENVTVSSSTLSGHAWSANSGWINFSPEQGGVLNNGTGDLSGYAWGENLGWIDFNNVSINVSTGQFSGTATGSLIGTLTFDCSNCDVRTDWHRTNSNLIGGGGGIFRPLSWITEPSQPTVTPIISGIIPVSVNNPLVSNVITATSLKNTNVVKSATGTVNKKISPVSSITSKLKTPLSKIYTDLTKNVLTIRKSISTSFSRVPATFNNLKTYTFNFLNKIRLLFKSK